MSPKIRVIFWDVDGVLNHPEIWGAWVRLGYAASLDPVIVERAARLVEDTGALCVLSSTWRLGGPTTFKGRDCMSGYVRTVECLLESGWANAFTDFIGHTPHLGTTRGIEIGDWLVAHPQVDEFVIIDDDADMGNHINRLVKTDHRVGLTDADCERVKALFGGGGDDDDDPRVAPGQGDGGVR